MLVFLTISRPNNVYTVHINQLIYSGSTLVHYAALHIIRYLHGTITRTLLFGSSLKLQAYSKADWAEDPTTSCSIAGFCIFLGVSLISWWAKKHDMVSKSIVDIEYQAMSSTTLEIVWLRNLLAHGYSVFHSYFVILWQLECYQNSQQLYLPWVHQVHRGTLPFRHATLSCLDSCLAEHPLLSLDCRLL